VLDAAAAICSSRNEEQVVCCLPAVSACNAYVASLPLPVRHTSTTIRARTEVRRLNFAIIRSPPSSSVVRNREE
jgi:hypothetical protein